jgi:hypothetical protein
MSLPSSVSNTYRSVHTYSFPVWLSQSATVPQTSSYAFVANASITDFTSWAAVFDQYRVLGIELFLEPSTTEALITGTAPLGRLYTVIDYDDSSALTSISAACAYDNCISTTLNQRQRRCFAPRVALAAYGTGAFTSYTNEAAPWIDCASGAVNHYGLKAIVDTGAAGALGVWNLLVRTHVEFRAAR